MGATVKTLFEDQDTIFWGSYFDDPAYHAGVLVDFQNDVFTAQAVYVMSDVSGGEWTVTPETLVDCPDVEALKAHNIFLASTQEDPESCIGWFCIEEFRFNIDALPELEKSSSEGDDYLSVILEILHILAQKSETALEALDEISLFDLREELEDITGRIDDGALTMPLPFSMHLIGEPLLGWQFADPEAYRWVIAEPLLARVYSLLFKNPINTTA